MNHLFLCITLCFLGASTCFSKTARDFVKFPAPDYEIISDVEVRGLPIGMVRITGVGYDPNGNVIRNAQIGTMDERYTTKTDSAGQFELLIHHADTAIHYFVEEYREILISGYDFKAGHAIKIHFYPKYMIVEPADPPIVPVVTYKPVIYLYSDEPLTTSVSFNYKGELTFVYPNYENGWTMKVGPSGMMDTKTGKAYPYLFWEGEIDRLYYKTEAGRLEGSVVKTDTLISFLEHQLTALGLNQTEQADFITFWGPRMTTSNYVFVQFLENEGYVEQISTLNISPKPETLQRIYLLFTPYESEPQLECQPQIFNNNERKGFTVVEWGGSQINLKHG